MNPEEIESEIYKLDSIVGIDLDVIDYFIQDIYHCKRLFILELENDEYLSINFVEKLKESDINTEINLITNEKQFPENCSDTDCILAISLTGENPTTNNIVKTAKSKDSYIYSICSNPYSELARLSDDCIEIDASNFEEDTSLYLDTSYKGVNFFYNKVSEYHSARIEARSSGPQPLSIMKPLFDSWNETITTQSNTHFNQEAKKAERNMVISVIIIIIITIIIVIWMIYMTLHSFNII